ncbi:hypothetical protein EV180_001138 [Coemansia sp. RSA 518]|nr:hypothetical protein EV180_001138 [Coemansia sp. RSA 518]
MLLLPELEVSSLSELEVSSLLELEVSSLSGLEESSLSELDKLSSALEIEEMLLSDPELLLSLSLKLNRSESSSLRISSSLNPALPSASMRISSPVVAVNDPHVQAQKHTGQQHTLG